jgi:hypothetical protein
MVHCVMNIYLSHSSNKRLAGVRRMLCLLTVAVSLASCAGRAELLDQDMTGLSQEQKRLATEMLAFVETMENKYWRQIEDLNGDLT